LLWRWWFDFKRDWNAMIDAMSLPKIKRSFLLWAKRFLLSISLAKWPRVSFAVLRRIGQSALSVQPLLWRWWFDFKRDWNAMIDAMSLPKIKRSFLRRLHQPIR
jgi:hypothetical protein